MNNPKTKILMYHSIGPLQNAEVGASLYSVPLENFGQQMEYLSRIAKTGTVPCGDSPCVITFDDGDISNYKYAYPILLLLELKAYFFILVGNVGKGGYMNWGQIKELRDAGMVIGSHGMTHRILTELSEQDLEYELKDSKKILENNLGSQIDYLSIPRGFCNKKITDKAKKVGYKAVFTSIIKDTDGFKFGRIAVKENWDLEYFIRVLNNSFSLKDKAEAVIKSSSKKILGAKNYDKLRKVILSKYQGQSPKNNFDIANSGTVPKLGGSPCKRI